MASPNKSIAAAETIRHSIDAEKQSRFTLLHGSEPLPVRLPVRILRVSHAIAPAKDFNLTVLCYPDTNDSLRGPAV